MFLVKYLKKITLLKYQQKHFIHLQKLLCTQ